MVDGVGGEAVCLVELEQGGKGKEGGGQEGCWKAGYLQQRYYVRNPVFEHRQYEANDKHHHTVDGSPADGGQQPSRRSKEDGGASWDSWQPCK